MAGRLNVILAMMDDINGSVRFGSGNQCMNITASVKDTFQHALMLGITGRTDVLELDEADGTEGLPTLVDGIGFDKVERK